MVSLGFRMGKRALEMVDFWPELKRGKKKAMLNHDELWEEEKKKKKKNWTWEMMMMIQIMMGLTLNGRFKNCCSLGQAAGRTRSSCQFFLTVFGDDAEEALELWNKFHLQNRSKTPNIDEKGPEIRKGFSSPSCCTNYEWMILIFFFPFIHNKKEWKFLLLLLPSGVGMCFEICVEMTFRLMMDLISGIPIEAAPAARN